MPVDNSTLMREPQSTLKKDSGLRIDGIYSLLASVRSCESGKVCKKCNIEDSVIDQAL
jgi:hypothetical protein